MNFEFEGIQCKFNLAEQLIIMGTDAYNFPVSKERTNELVYLKITNNCNISCSYCFQRYDIKNNQVLNIENYAQLLEEFTPETEFVIFGGEPLLSENIKNIKYILSKLKSNNKIKFFTNGNFEADIIELLEQYKDFIYAVITLDGEKTIHDSRRVNQKQSSYDLIMENCKKLKSLNIDFIIQINIDSENILGIPDLLNELDNSFGNKVHIGLNRVRHSALSLSEYDILDFYFECQRTNYKSNLSVNSFTLNNLVNCFAGRELVSDRCNIKNTKVFDFTSNEIYSCPQSLNKVTGSFNEKESVIDKQVIEKYFKVNIKENNRCNQCKAKLFCSEGCIIEENSHSCLQNTNKKISLILSNLNLLF